MVNCLDAPSSPSSAALTRQWVLRKGKRQLRLNSPNDQSDFDDVKDILHENRNMMPSLTVEYRTPDLQRAGLGKRTLLHNKGERSLSLGLMKAARFHVRPSTFSHTEPSCQHRTQQRAGRLRCSAPYRAALALSRHQTPLVVCDS